MHRLTERQREVAVLLTAGRSNAEVAAAIGCSVKTAEAHVTRILRRLGCGSRTAAAARLLGGDGERPRSDARCAAEWGLSPLEAEVLARVVSGASNKEIATALDRAEATIEGYLTAIFARSGCRGRRALAARVWAMA